MNFDTLRPAWHAEVDSMPSGDDLDRLTRSALACDRRYRRGAATRRALGSTAFALTLAVLAVVALLPGVWPGMRLATAIWATSLFGCGLGLWRLRVGRRAGPEAPTTTYLRECLEDVGREIAYQRNLRWWFWAPFGVGFLAAILWGAPHAHGTTIWLAMPTAVLWIWGFIHGPRHWPKRLYPVTRQLQSMLDDPSLHAGEPLHQGDIR